MSETLTKPGLMKSIGTALVRRKAGQRPRKRAGGGVVNFCVGRPKVKIKATDFTPSKLINVIQAGLRVRELKDLQSSLAVPMERLGPMLDISKATLHRRMAGGRLGPAESDRVVRFALLMGKAVGVLESEGKARQWLTSPQFGLGGAVPLDYARTEVGAREVEDLLGRIEYGVYS
ncbi:MAG: antitoxin Xre/MbcA/ParS toxin-binding domain-containing protein [Limisphaerales bacterium]